MVFQKKVNSHTFMGSSVKFFSGYVHPAVSNFFQSCLGVPFFARLRKSRSKFRFVCVFLECERLAHAFKILPSVCLGISRALREKRYSRFLTKHSNP